MRRFSVSEINKGERLDVFVAEKLSLVSRAFVRKLNDDGKILVDGRPQKSGYKLHTGDKVTVDYSAKELEQIPDIDIPILYEDPDCIVINKPAGLLTHSKGAFNPEATVATWLRSKLSKDNAVAAKLGQDSNNRAGIVHRLDRGTSGVMIAAKHAEALSWLQKQFSTRRVKKTYEALVSGRLEPSEAIIDMPIERNPRRPQTFRVGSRGKAARTLYKVKQTANNLSLVELKPETGRTHQLRVHLQKLGHPIVGDTFYNGLPADRLLLHAVELELTLPDHTRKTFTAPLPKEFKSYLKAK